MTDPREPFETDSPVEGGTATDLDDARLGEPGAADLDTGAAETGAAEASSDTADLDTASEVADVVPEIEDGDTDALASDPLAAPAPPRPGNGCLHRCAPDGTPSALPAPPRPARRRPRPRLRR